VFLGWRLVEYHLNFSDLKYVFVVLVSRCGFRVRLWSDACELMVMVRWLYEGCVVTEQKRRNAERIAQ
jgi:hypothetical protein